jgi:hypothetical protein
MLVSLKIVHGFLNRYYDPTTFRTEDKEVVNEANDFVLSAENIHSLLSSLFTRIKSLHDLKSKYLTKEDSHILYDAAHTLGLLLSDADIGDLENAKDDENSQRIEASEDEELVQNEHEIMVQQKFTEFRSALNLDENLSETIRKESLQFVEVLESIPFLIDENNHETDLRYEPFIKKLVNHVYESLDMVNNEKFLNPRCTRSTRWMVKSFRVVIENRWGKTIHERDQEGGEEDDLAAQPVVEAFNTCGVTALCVDLIATGIDEGLQVECVKLLIAMLYKEGGALLIQETVNKHLNSKDFQLFFNQIRRFLQDLISWHKWHENDMLEDDTDPDFPEYRLIVRFWQLLSEGHYLPNQNITREQQANLSSINLLDDMVQYMAVISRISSRTSTVGAISMAATILEVLQGPCVKNQSYLALNTDLLETMNRILRSKTPSDGIYEEELELKTTIIDIFRGLLEGQPSKSAVYDRVISVLHFDILQNICYPIVVEDESSVNIKKVADSEEMETLKIQCLVLLQSLCDYSHELRSELSLPSEIPEDVGCVEVMWNGQLQRRFFHIPDICWFLAESSKFNLVLNVNRSSVESKLHDFLDRVNGLYTEIKHQQLLTSLNLSQIFSISVMDQVTWFSFIVVTVINILFLVYYNIQIDGIAHVSHEAEAVIDGLNILLIISAAFTLILVFVVKVPVLYQGNKVEGRSRYLTIFYTLTDSIVLYYFLYLGVSIVGFTVSHYWLSFLLLDLLIKDAVAGSVLNAIVFPRMQILMTVVLMLFLCFIFAFFKVFSISISSLNCILLPNSIIFISLFFLVCFFPCKFF